MLQRLLLTVLLGLMLLGCGSSPTLSPPAAVVPSGPTRYPLPADSSLNLGPGDSPQACAGIGLDAIARGSPTDARHVWLEDATAGGRIDLVWPTGYTARFTPDVEVVDTTGRVVLSAGQRVDSGCVTGQDNVLWLPNW
jgi:hypothetical protein